MNLLSINIDEIRISFDGYTKETYEKIRKGLNFDVISSNIIKFGQLKKRMGKSDIILKRCLFNCSHAFGVAREYAFTIWHSQ